MEPGGRAEQQESASQFRQPAPHSLASSHTARAGEEIGHTVLAGLEDGGAVTTYLAIQGSSSTRFLLCHPPTHQASFFNAVICEGGCL